MTANVTVGNSQMIGLTTGSGTPVETWDFQGRSLDMNDGTQWGFLSNNDGDSLVLTNLAAIADGGPLDVSRTVNGNAGNVTIAASNAVVFSSGGYIAAHTVNSGADRAGNVVVRAGSIAIGGAINGAGIYAVHDETSDGSIETFQDVSSSPAGWAGAPVQIMTTGDVCVAGNIMTYSHDVGGSAGRVMIDSSAGNVVVNGYVNTKMRNTGTDSGCGGNVSITGAGIEINGKGTEGAGIITWTREDGTGSLPGNANLVATAGDVHVKYAINLEDTQDDTQNGDLAVTASRKILLDELFMDEIGEAVLDAPYIRIMLLRWAPIVATNDVDPRLDAPGGKDILYGEQSTDDLGAKLTLGGQTGIYNLAGGGKLRPYRPEGFTILIR